MKTPPIEEKIDVSETIINKRINELKELLKKNYSQEEKNILNAKINDLMTLGYEKENWEYYVNTEF